MCADAGVEGTFTNHSLRATGATVLFDAGVPEAVIQKRTGHKSLDALRSYEQVTLDQEKCVANILTPKSLPQPEDQDTSIDTSVCTSVDTSADEVFLDSLPEEAYISSKTFDHFSNSSSFDHLTNSFSLITSANHFIFLQLILFFCFQTYLWVLGFIHVSCLVKVVVTQRRHIYLL